MENRFLAYAASVPAATRIPRRATPTHYARSFTANQRALVILIENGGIDLGIPELVDKLFDALPAAGLITSDMRRALVNVIREKLRSATDVIIESAELALNRYAKAAPEFFDSVTVLRDASASYEDLKRKLIELSTAGKLIDLLILTHGRDNLISVPGDIDGQKIRDMRTAYGRALNLRSVYMMNCVGASLNEAWIAAGAKASCGSIRYNYLPEPTTHFFWENWKAGQNFETAATSAYRRTVRLMNDTVRGFINDLPLPGTSILAGQINFEDFDFVQGSAPVIQGQRSISIASDDLSFGQSTASSLATTVVPVSLLKGLASGRVGRDGAVSRMQSHVFESPSQLTADPATYSRQQNPAGVVIAGVTVGDAMQVGLGAAALVQSQVNGSSGSFNLFYDRAQHLLTNEARQQMPGAQSPKSSYRRGLFWIAMGKPGWASADVIIEWEGNAYGEIGTAVIRKNLPTSSDWSRSSASISITKLERIPLPGSDPRVWPIVFTYEGTYDPVGNGHFEFSGEFEINAFGGLKFNRHEVVSRSFLDLLLAGPDEYVSKGFDAVVPVPEIPQEQIVYLRSKLG